jgi:ABC-type glucose/galactose transport system permease subunit
MPLELSKVVKNTCQLSMNSRGLNVIFCSKIYTTVVLTFVIIILIMLIYPSKKNTSGFVFVKLCIYIFIATLGTIMIHDGVLHNDTMEKTGCFESDDFVDRISADDVVYGDDSIEITANTGVSGVSGGNQINTEKSDKVSDPYGDLLTMYGV